MTPDTSQSSKNLRLLSVTFSEPITPEEIECFRGAVAEKVGLAHDRYHNHNNAGEGGPAFHYRYPLVQYQLSRGRPRIVFLDEAVEDAHHFFTQPDWNLQINGRPYHTAIDELKALQYPVGVTPGRFHYYRLHRWQALNTDNYPQFLAMEPLREKAAFLERVLCGQLLSFFSGIDMRLPHRFQLDITRWDRTHSTSYKGIKALVFDVSFRAELLLPVGVGVGKGVGLGFGRVGREEVNSTINPE